MRKFLFFLISIVLINNLSAQVIGVLPNDFKSVSIQKFNNKFQLVDSSDKILISDLDQIIKDENSDRYKIEKDGKWGLYSNVGKELIPIEFDNIERAYNWIWIVENNNMKGLYNINHGKLLPTIYTSFTFTYRFDSEIIVEKDNLYGIFNEKGKEILPIVYENISMENGLIKLIKNGKKTYLIDNKIVDYCIESRFYVYGDYPSDNRLYYVIQDGESKGILDDENKVTIKPVYEDIIVNHTNSRETMIFVKKDGFWGIIDINGNILIPIEYQNIEYFNDEYFIIEENNLKRFYNLNDNQFIDDYYFDSYYVLEKYTRINRSGKQTLIENKNPCKLLFPFFYEDIYTSDGNLFYVKEKDKQGIIDKNNEIVIPIIYDAVTVFCSDKLIVEKDNLYGILNLKNEVLIPLDKRHIISYSDKFERMKEDSLDTEFFDCDFNLIEQ